MRAAAAIDVGGGASSAGAVSRNSECPQRPHNHHEMYVTGGTGAPTRDMYLGLLAWHVTAVITVPHCKHTLNGPSRPVPDIARLLPLLGTSLRRSVRAPR
jgi:hypothetical protein